MLGAEQPAAHFERLPLQLYRLRALPCPYSTTAMLLRFSAMFGWSAPSSLRLIASASRYAVSATAGRHVTAARAKVVQGRSRFGVNVSVELAIHVQRFPQVGLGVVEPAEPLLRPRQVPSACASAGWTAT